METLARPSQLISTSKQTARCIEDIKSLITALTEMDFNGNSGKIRFLKMKYGL